MKRQEFLSLLSRQLFKVISRCVTRTSFPKSRPQGKLVSVLKGEVFDVAVDLRPSSPTFGQWEAVILSDQNKFQFWVPPGLLCGFVVLSESADFAYKCTECYDPEDNTVPLE